MMKFDKYLKKPVNKANQLFKERNNKYVVVDAYVPAPGRPTSPSFSDLESKERFSSQLGRDEQEAIRKYERKSPLLPKSVGAQKLSDPLPSTSKCTNTASNSSTIAVRSKKKRKIKSPCLSVPSYSNKQAFNNYQPIIDIDSLTGDVTGMSDKKPEPTPNLNVDASSISSQSPTSIRITPTQSYFPQHIAGKPFFPTFIFSPPVFTPTSTASASISSATVVPEKGIKREATSSPDIEVIADLLCNQPTVVLPTLKQPELPKTTDEEKEKLQILFDICAQEIKINNDLKEIRKDIDDLQKKINIARADERKLNKNLASLVQQKTEIVNKCNQKKLSDVADGQHQ